MIRIAYVIDTIETPSAGTEKQLLLLLSHLDKSRFEPHLICLRDSEWLRENEVPVPLTVLGLNSLRSPSAVGVMRRFRRYCRQNRIDIVQSFFSDSNLFATVAAWVSRIPLVVASRRNFGKASWHTPTWLFVLRRLARMTDLYIANSRLIADYTIEAEHVPADRMHVIYNGLDLSRFEEITPDMRRATRAKYSIAEDQVLIGIVANIRPIKNHTLFVEAAAVIHERYPQSRFVMVGDGSSRPDIDRQIAAHNLDDVIIRTGQLRDTMPLLAAMDIGVLCSRGESLSNAIIEYMAARLPAVVSEVGGNREAVGGQFGLVFPDNDRDAMVAALEKLILEPDLRRELGQKAAEFAARTYDLAASIARHEHLYEEYLARTVRKPH